MQAMKEDTMNPFMLTMMEDNMNLMLQEETFWERTLAGIHPANPCT